MNAQRKKVGLALGSGAARGFAHIGVLKTLEQAKVPIDLVVGTSMGGVVGALYCSGMSLRMMERLAGATQRNLWMDLTFPRMGLISGEKLEQFILMFTKSATFAQLKKPFAVVATDLGTGEKVVINKGLVAPAVRATAAIPAIFCPVEYEGRTLVDGAVVERVPAITARELGAEIVIAVDVGVYTQEVKVSHIFDVVLQCLDIMSRDLCRQGISQADLLISPQLHHVLPGQFHKAAEAIRAGEEAALVMLPKIRELLRREGCYEQDAANT
ncbi:MAG: patatin-like phospholipase family protein [Dethiobacter sp.]|jgi:NTE family protein|nr:patatin-like phospholipase family protein [Dethiobacter sp.]